MTPAVSVVNSRALFGLPLHMQSPPTGTSGGFPVTTNGETKPGPLTVLGRALVVNGSSALGGALLQLTMPIAGKPSLPARSVNSLDPVKPATICPGVTP